MPRKGYLEVIRLSARMPRGRDGYWAVIRGLDQKGPWSVPDVHELTNEPHKESVNDYVKRLERAGFVKQVGEVLQNHRGTPTRLFRLLKRPAAAPALRRDGSVVGVHAQQRMWNAIRSLKQFTLSELAHAAADDKGTSVKIGVAQAYVHRLRMAGYITGLSRSDFRLKPSMNTGPRSPRILKMHVVFDDNLMKLVGGDTVDAEEVA
jgi:hypothetical protein